MNLADIRKKAQKERTEVLHQAPTQREQQPAVEPPVQEMESVPAVEIESIPVKRQEIRQPQISVVKAPLQNFDPLALLLAGRERAGCDEEMLLSETESPETDDDFQEFLCFRVSSEKYAINIMEIKEIIKPREITEVPRVPSYVEGVLSLRGIIIPVFKMCSRLGLPEIGSSGKERIIVVRKGEEFCGVLVDEVLQVVKIASAGIEQPPAVLEGIDREFVNGIGRHSGKMLILLNLENILDLTLC